jgi:hypothetical protein
MHPSTLSEPVIYQLNHLGATTCVGGLDSPVLGSQTAAGITDPMQARSLTKPNLRHGADGDHVPLRNGTTAAPQVITTGRS